MDYTLCGNYRLPNLLPAQEEEHKIEIYGQRYFRYIKEHDKMMKLWNRSPTTSMRSSLYFPSKASKSKTENI